MTKFILSRVTIINRPAAFTITALLLLSGIATATDVKVVSSGGFAIFSAGIVVGAEEPGPGKL
jgi:hypothetical protein